MSLSPNGQNSRVDASGQTVTVNGGTVQATYLPGTYVTRQYTLVTADAVNGAFTSLANSGLPAGFVATLLYTPTTVVLDLQSLLSTAAGLNANQQELATALTTYFNNGGALPPGLVALFGSRARS